MVTPRIVQILAKCGSVARKDALTRTGSTSAYMRAVVIGTGFPGVGGDPGTEQMKGHEEESITEEGEATTTTTKSLKEDAKYRKIAQPC